MKRYLITRVLFILAAFAISQSAMAQESMTPEQKAEAQKRFNQSIEQRVITILESVELTEEQLKPMQEALVAFFAPMQIEQIKMQAERRKMEASGGGRASMDRQAMMQRRQRLEKLRSDTNKKIKDILDKKQYKNYIAAMEKLMPAQRRGPGGGGGRGGR